MMTGEGKVDRVCKWAPRPTSLYRSSTRPNMQSMSRNALRSACRQIKPSMAINRLNHTNAQHGPSSESRTTHFGFKTVPEEAKESLVKNVFDSVASSYDVMNDAMSLGVHRLWKDDYVSSLKPGRKGPMRCIDLAGGTGDIALRILDHARENYADRETTVDVVDINAEMLKEGYKRFKKTMYHNSKLSFRHLSSEPFNIWSHSTTNSIY